MKDISDIKDTKINDDNFQISTSGSFGKNI